MAKSPHTTEWRAMVAQEYLEGLVLLTTLQINMEYILKQFKDGHNSIRNKA